MTTQLNEKSLYENFIKLALAEAQKGEGLVSPNPLVGCVLVCNDEIIETGFHGEMGKLHAERVVFEKIKQKNRQIPKDAILFVTLEPCCHHGKTPPCTDAILESGIKKVVIAQSDPNPLVAEQGIRILEKAEIEVIQNICEAEAKWQTRFFRHAIVKQESYCVAKLAISANDFYAPKSQEKEQITWISSKESRNKTRAMRQAFDAILIGKKTILLDNPKLDIEDSLKTLPRIIICKTLNFTKEELENLQVFRDHNVIIAYQKISKDFQDHFFKGELLQINDLHDLKKKLFQKGFQSLLLEGGGDLLEAFLKEDLVEEFWQIQSKNRKLKSGKQINKILLTDFNLEKKEDWKEDFYSCFVKK